MSLPFYDNLHKIEVALGMRFKEPILFVSLFLGFVNAAKSQQTIFNKTYTINDGLISNSVRRIYQDSKGFLWMATIEGLSKYDGHKFTNYSTTNGLSHNMVNDFHETGDGKIYIALNDGSLNVIDENAILKKVSGNIIINRFRLMHNHEVIVATDFKGLYKFKNGELTKPHQTFPFSIYNEIIELNDSLLLAGTDHSLHLLNRKFELFSEIKSPVSTLTNCIYIDSKKRVWAGLTQGLRLLSIPDKTNQPLKFAPLPAPFNLSFLQQYPVQDIKEDHNGNIWIATSHGLVKIYPDGEWKILTEKNGLPSDNINCIYEDKERNIWIGTSLGLVKFITATDIRFFTEDNGLASDKLNFMLRLVNGNLLVRSEKGLQIFDKLNRSGISPLLKNSHPYYGAVQNSDPLLLIGKNRLAIYNSATHHIGEPIYFNPPLNAFFCAVADHYGNIFIGDHNGLFIYSGGRLEKVPAFSGRIEALLLDKKGNLWVGTWNNGLYRIQYSTGKNIIEFPAKNIFHYLPDKQIRSLFEDSKGNLWAGTRYHGVYQLKQKASNEYSLQVIDQSKGLTSNWITDISEDARGNIWIAFYQGLDKLIVSETPIQVFNFSRIHNFFTNIHSIIPENKNSLWLATSRGIVNITDEEMEKKPPLPIYITSVSAGNKIYNPRAFKNEEKLQLAYQQNQLLFEFTSPGYINEKHILYSYRLSGSSNREWSPPSNQHTVSYASLKAGEYRFEVRALGWNTNWGVPSVFEFIIVPPFWQTWWFLSICGLLTSTAIYLGVRKRIAGIRRQAEMKNKIAETEMIALRAQMNPHFIFNCLNSIDNLIQNNEKEKATTYLAKFAKLIRAILENSKSNTIPCWKDLETLKLYLELEEFRCDKKFSYFLNIPLEILQGDYKVPPMVIQPYVENAILHGLLNKVAGTKKLNIDVNVENNQVNYIIEDNGIGRQKAAEYKQINKSTYQSMGLDITHDRINLFNQKNNGSITITDLYDETNQPAGTRVEVHLYNQSLI